MSNATFKIGDRLQDDGGWSCTVVQVLTSNGTMGDIRVIYDHEQPSKSSVPPSLKDPVSKLGLSVSTGNWNGWSTDFASSFKKLPPVDKSILKKGDRVLVAISYDDKCDVVPATVLIDLDTYESFPNGFSCPVVLFDKPHADAGLKNPSDPEGGWEGKELAAAKAAAKDLGLQFSGNKLAALVDESTLWGGVRYRHEVLMVMHPEFAPGDYVELIESGDIGVMIDEYTLALETKVKGAVKITDIQSKVVYSDDFKPKWAISLRNQAVRKTTKPIAFGSLSVGDKIEFVDDASDIGVGISATHIGTVVSDTTTELVVWVKNATGEAICQSSAFDKSGVIDFNAKKLGLAFGAHFTGVSEIKRIIAKAPPSPKLEFADLQPGEEITFSVGDDVVSGTLLLKTKSGGTLAIRRDKDALDIPNDIYHIDEKTPIQQAKIRKATEAFGIKANSDLSLIDINKNTHILERTAFASSNKRPASWVKVGDKVLFAQNGKDYEGVVCLDRFDTNSIDVVVATTHDTFAEVNHFGKEHITRANFTKLGLSSNSYPNFVNISAYKRCLGFVSPETTPPEIAKEPEKGVSMQSQKIDVSELQLGDKVELRLKQVDSNRKMITKKVIATYLTDKVVVLSRPTKVGSSNSWSLNGDYDDSRIGTLAEALSKLSLKLNQNTARLWEIGSDDTEIIRITKRANAHQQKDRTMGTEAKETTGVWEQMKADASEAAYRTCADKMVDGVRNAIVVGLKAKGGDGPKAAMAEAFLESEYGKAMIATALGQGLQYVPGMDNDPRVAKIAAEFRISGINVVMGELVDGAMDLVVPAIKDAMKGLPPMTEKAGTGVRVKAPQLVREEEQNEEKVASVGGSTQRR